MGEPKEAQDNNMAMVPNRLPNIRYVLTAVVVVAMVVHIEMGFALRHVPEMVLIQTKDAHGLPQEGGRCFADIFSGEILIEKKKPLRALESIYEVIDPRAFFANTDGGFHVLETGLPTYGQSFEIRIVCYTAELEGVSHTVLNEENQIECSVEDGGRVLVC